jgi:hypothetical protein
MFYGIIIRMYDDTLYLESKALEQAQSQRKRRRGQKGDLAMATIPKKKSPKARAAAK